MLDEVSLLADAGEVASRERTARAGVVATEPERRHGQERGSHPRSERGPAPPHDEAGQGQERPGLRAKQRGEEGEREAGSVLLLEMAVERAEQQRREQRLGLADARLEQPARQEQKRDCGEHARPRPGGAAAEAVGEEQRDRRAGPDDEEPRPGRHVSQQRERDRDQARKRLPARVAHRRERQRPDQLAPPQEPAPGVVAQRGGNGERGGSHEYAHDQRHASNRGG